jgi:serpin B
LTRLVLVNAIYFLGDWVEAFDRARTTPRPFSVAHDRTKDVPMMWRSGTYRHARDVDASILELPYHGGASMLVVLPDDTFGLPAVEANLDVGTLERWQASLRPREVHVSIPRFTLDATEPLKLATELRVLGMSRPFDAGRADFTGIAAPPSAEDGLYVTDVVHKAFVKVDEQGTEAAAATVVEMALRGGPSQTPSFVADHPFLFFILDQITGLILFAGRVSDPG